MFIGTIHLLMQFDQSRFLVYILLSASVEKSLEANRNSPLLYHPKFDCLIQKNPSPLSVFNLINPAHILTSCFMMHIALKICNILFLIKYVLFLCEFIHLTRFYTQ